MERLVGLIGIGLMVAVAWGLSSDRRRFPVRLVLAGIALQLVLAVLFLKTAGVVLAVDKVASVINGVISQANAGIAFVFGPNLGDDRGPWGFIFAVKVLPVIIFFASLMSVMYYLGVMQRLVAALAWLLQRTLGVTGTEALAMASNVFVGQTEAPLCIKPYLNRMTRSQLNTLMVGGFATIAGSVMAAYVGILGGDDDAQRVLYLKHLLTASVLSAPAAFVIAKIMVPETETPLDEGLRAAGNDTELTNVLDAAAVGATDGLRLALNVAAMLIAFVALLALVNWPIGEIGNIEAIAAWRSANGVPEFSLQLFLGWIFKPVAWCMGVPSEDCTLFGSLMGEKLIATEFIAYLHLGAVRADGTIGPRAAQIATYALCGFANFPSVAIQIGGLSALAPDRRRDFAQLALKAMIGGALASWMTASVAGVFISA